MRTGGSICGALGSAGAAGGRRAGGVRLRAGGAHRSVAVGAVRRPAAAAAAAGPAGGAAGTTSCMPLDLLWSQTLRQQGNCSHIKLPCISSERDQSCACELDVEVGSQMWRS